ncbi:unnamed protein product, partial [Didymodactylos carnosus]
CACDVPSNLYSFSFEPYSKWNHTFARQHEIRKYLEYLTDKHNLRPKIQFNAKVTEAQWLDDQNQWKVTIDNGRHFYSRFLVSAHGSLSDAHIPRDINGIDQFKGNMFHSAEWDMTYDLKGKRVAVIGTASSALQLVPVIQKEVKQLYVFQRTPQWIIPVADRKIIDFEKKLYERLPLIQQVIRAIIFWMRETTVLSFAYQWPNKMLSEHLVKYFLSKQVKDPELRKKLTPKWELGCKRVLFSSDWYSALQESNLKLVTDSIKQINEHSILTTNGDNYDLDTIIWSTGFKVRECPIHIRGLGDISINEQWKHSKQAYKCITVLNFPNLFFLVGPNTGVVHNSVIWMIESQITYILETIEYMKQNHFNKFLVKQQAFQQYNDYLQVQLKKSVWQLSSKSQSRDTISPNTRTWPGFAWSYRFMTRRFDHENYDLFYNKDQIGTLKHKKCI